MDYGNRMEIQRLTFTCTVSIMGELRDNVQFFLLTRYADSDWWYDIPIFNSNLKVDKFEFKSSVQSIETFIQSMEEQLRNSEEERSEMIAKLEALRIRERNLENRRVEAQQQLDECHRKEKDTNHWIMIAVFLGGIVIFLMIGIILFMLCRKSVKTSEEMKRELCAKR